MFAAMIIVNVLWLANEEGFMAIIIQTHEFINGLSIM